MELSVLLWDLGKKVIFGQYVCVEVVVTLYGSSSDERFASSALGTAVLYMLQIYFDFSGLLRHGGWIGQDVRLFVPVKIFCCLIRAVSIRDFWRKWHVFFQLVPCEYVYIPLGGNSQGDGAYIYQSPDSLYFFSHRIWHGCRVDVLYSLGFYHGFLIFWSGVFWGNGCGERKSGRF